MKKKLTGKNRLGGYSHYEIVRAYDALTADLGATLDWEGRKLKPGPLLNALVLHFVRNLSYEEQYRVAKWGLEELARFVDEEEVRVAPDSPRPVKLKVEGGAAGKPKGNPPKPKSGRGGSGGKDKKRG